MYSHKLLTDLVVGQSRALLLDLLVTLLAVDDVSVGRSWNLGALGSRVRTLHVDGLRSAWNNDEHSAILHDVTRSSEIVALVLVVASVKNRLAKFDPV
jgi:hypothetical protein